MASTPTAGALEITSAHLALEQAIVHEHWPNVEVRAFGSRAEGTAKRFSDLDLIVISTTALSDRSVALVADALAESALPFKVDIIDAAAADRSFRERAVARSVLVQAARPTR